MEDPSVGSDSAGETECETGADDTGVTQFGASGPAQHSSFTQANSPTAFGKLAIKLESNETEKFPSLLFSAGMPVRFPWSQVQHTSVSHKV